MHLSSRMCIASGTLERKYALNLALTRRAWFSHRLSHRSLRERWYTTGNHTGLALSLSLQERRYITDIHTGLALSLSHCTALAHAVMLLDRSYSRAIKAIRNRRLSSTATATATGQYLSLASCARRGAVRRRRAPRRSTPDDDRVKC